MYRGKMMRHREQAVCEDSTRATQLHAKGCPRPPAALAEAWDRPPIALRRADTLMLDFWLPQI